MGTNSLCPPIVWSSKWSCEVTNCFGLLVPTVGDHLCSLNPVIAACSSTYYFSWSKTDSADKTVLHGTNTRFGGCFGEGSANSATINVPHGGKLYWSKHRIITWEPYVWLKKIIINSLWFPDSPALSWTLWCHFLLGFFSHNFNFFTTRVHYITLQKTSQSVVTWHVRFSNDWSWNLYACWPLS